MARGRGSAVVGAGAVLLICSLVMAGGPPLAEAARSYVVGDGGGWRFNTAGWTNGKTFRAGDVLEFRYNRAVHDVAAVDEAAYRTCRVPSGTRALRSGTRALRSGHEKVKLTRGRHYFVCTVPGHCKANMKIAVRVD